MALGCTPTLCLLETARNLTTRSKRLCNVGTIGRNVHSCQKKRNAAFLRCILFAEWKKGMTPRSDLRRMLAFNDAFYSGCMRKHTGNMESAVCDSILGRDYFFSSLAGSINFACLSRRQILNCSVRWVGWCADCRPCFGVCRPR